MKIQGSVKTKTFEALIDMLLKKIINTFDKFNNTLVTESKHSGTHPFGGVPAKLAHHINLHKKKPVIVTNKIVNTWTTQLISVGC